MKDLALSSLKELLLDWEKENFSQNEYEEVLMAILHEIITTCEITLYAYKEAKEELIIGVKNLYLVVELSFQSNFILEKINEKLTSLNQPKIKKLRFKLVES